MQAQIALDQPHNVWTNLDFITGKVILKLQRSATISSIVVKLEGESKTRLNTLDGRGMNEVTNEEIHKTLYRTSRVFPPEAVEKAQSSQQNHLTMNAGQHEFPFSFKIPFNNACEVNQPSTSLTNVIGGLANLRLHARDAGIRQPVRHVKTTLPPTLTAFPGVAEIRYYLKVTVNRKEIYKENPRVLQYLNFLPIEPPRTPQTAAETYARRQHEFTETKADPSKSKSFFGSLRKGSASGPTGSETPPHFSLDARLPSPANITCNEDVPMRLIVKHLQNNPNTLYLHSLRIDLIGHTHIRANEVYADEKTGWIIVNRTNIGQALRSSVGGEGGLANEEIIVDPQAWRGCPLPPSVAPSFFTCNIGRKYELDIHVGIGYGPTAAKNFVVLPLRHTVEVYSGIKPPAALLAAMNNPPSVQPPEKSAAGTTPTYHTHSTTQAGPSSRPDRPAIPPRPEPSKLATAPTEDEPPPPSYEDAMATNMAPVDGPRRTYEPPAMSDGNNGWDRKGSRGS